MQTSQHRQHIVVGLLLFVVVMLPGVAVAAEPSVFTAVQTACTERVDKLAGEIHSAALWRGVVAIVSAAIAALGSAVAAFAHRTTVRRFTGVAGAIGAIVAALPNLIPSSDENLRVKKLSEQHKLFAEKVLYQLPTLKNEDYIEACTRYVVARYASCASPAPDSDIPALPEPQLEIRGREGAQHLARDPVIVQPVGEAVAASKKLPNSPALPQQLRRLEGLQNAPIPEREATRIDITKPVRAVRRESIAIH